jgi:hypothetical protein
MANQGIVSFSYDPTAIYTVAGPDTTWTDDVYNLKPASPLLLVRTPIQANANDNTLGSPGYPEFQAAMDTWGTRSGGFPVAAVLPMEFDRPNIQGSCPNDILGYNGNPLLNAYINDFTLRAEDFASNLASHHLTTYWVWNEPNLQGQIGTGQNCPPSDPSLSPQVFGALLYQGCTRLKAGGAITTYAGSLSVLPGSDPTGQNAANYLAAMYQFLNQNGVSGPYPWDAISLNMEGLFDTTFTQPVHDNIQATMQTYGDYSPIIVGEWGVRNSELDPTRAQTTYDAIKAYFQTMYFFQHPARVQHNGNDYGARDWNISGSQYVPASKLLWWDVLNSFYQNP